MITPDNLKLFFSNKYQHGAYEKTVQLAQAMRTHADGAYPEELIETRRPSESEAVREYRRAIWQPITKPYLDKVLASLNKIRRSTEWGIRFDPAAIPARIPEAETLEQYINTGFPHFTSLTNWAFALLIREYAVDANAWVVVMPENWQTPENEYVRPFPYIFRADQIVDFQDSEYVVIKRDEKVLYTEDQHQYWGDSYYIITGTDLQQWDQTGKDRRFTLSAVYEHGIGQLPAFKLSGKVVQSSGNVFIHESRLAPMLPRLDEAIREYSDLQAEVVQHIHSERWEIGQIECESCKGTGHLNGVGFRGRIETCSTCHGNGYKPRGPYTTLMVKPPMAGDSLSTPTPPMGYLTKDTRIVEVQDERINKHIWHGLSAINMEFLAEKPLNQSGVAKAYDADETNNFVHGIAEDIVAVLDNVCYLIAEYRYRMIVPDAAARRVMLPFISVPERFDLFSAQVIGQELQAAKTAKVSPVIINAMELEYATKKFSTDPAIGERLALIIRLDPLAGVSEDDKMVRLSNGGITKETYIVSCNVVEFVDRALEEQGEAFAAMAYKEQKEVLLGYAREQAGSGNAAATVINGLYNDIGA